MPLRPLYVSVLIFIVVIIAIFQIESRLHHKHVNYIVASNQRWVGVIDMDGDHGIDMEGIIQGHDALLVVDNSNPLFQQIMYQSLQTKPFSGLTPFEIGEYDSNGDALLDTEDPIYPYFHIVIFNPEGHGYEVKTLAQAGIRGINLKRMNGSKNHQVIMSNGSRRTLYEINKPGGTAVYMNQGGKQVISLPEIPTSP